MSDDYDYDDYDEYDAEDERVGRKDETDMSNIIPIRQALLRSSREEDTL